MAGLPLGEKERVSESRKRPLLNTVIMSKKAMLFQIPLIPIPSIDSTFWTTIAEIIVAIVIFWEAYQTFLLEENENELKHTKYIVDRLKTPVQNAVVEYFADGIKIQKFHWIEDTYSSISTHCSVSGNTST